MKTIAHRGASGLALENTIASIELAHLIGVDAIEFDLRVSSDDSLVVVHDNDLKRVSGTNLKVNESTLSEIKRVVLCDGKSHVPTLQEALHAAGGTPVIIEVKVIGLANLLVEALKDYDKSKVIIASFHHDEIIELKKHLPGIKTYVAEHTRLFEIINIARSGNVNGIDLNFWLLNPLTYFLAKRYNLELMAYTVNNRLLASLIRRLYPSVAICTNHPEWFSESALPKRNSKKRKR